MTVASKFSVGNEKPWLLLTPGDALEQLLDTDTITWCCSEKRDVAWVLNNDGCVFAIHPLVSGREERGAARDALVLKSHEAIDISTASGEVQRMELSNVPTWLLSNLDVLAHAEHVSNFARCRVPPEKMLVSPLRMTLRSGTDTTTDMYKSFEGRGL